MILTDDEIDNVYSRLRGDTFEQALRSVDFARAIEQAILKKIGEPVAYQHRDGMLSYRLPGGGVLGIDWTPLYALPEVKK